MEETKKERLQSEILEITKQLNNLRTDDIDYAAKKAVLDADLYRRSMAYDEYSSVGSLKDENGKVIQPKSPDKYSCEVADSKIGVIVAVRARKLSDENF